MEDRMQTVIAIFVAFIIFFVFPIYFTYEKKDDISYALVLRYTQDFVNNIKSKGYITKEEYDEYLSKLDLTENTYDINMLHTQVKSNPVVPILPTELAYSSIEQTYDNKYIVNVLDNQNIYLMNEKDNFSIKVKNTNTTIATILYNTITINSIDVNTRIYVYCSTEILKEQWFDNEKYMKFYINDKATEITDKFVASSDDTFELKAEEPDISIINGIDIPIKPVNNISYSDNFTIEFQTRPGKTIDINNTNTSTNVNTRFTFTNYLLYIAPTASASRKVVLNVGANGMNVCNMYTLGGITNIHVLVSYTGTIYEDKVYKIAFKSNQKVIAIFENDKRLEYSKADSTPNYYNVINNTTDTTKSTYINSAYIGDIKSFKIYPTE